MMHTLKGTFAEEGMAHPEIIDTFCVPCKEMMKKLYEENPREPDTTMMLANLCDDDSNLMVNNQAEYLYSEGTKRELKTN